MYILAEKNQSKKYLLIDSFDNPHTQNDSPTLHVKITCRDDSIFLNYVYGRKEPFLRGLLNTVSVIE